MQQTISQYIWNMKYRNGEETVEDFFKRQADALGIDGIYEQLASQKLCLGGRCQYALGTNYQGQTLSNCFVVKIENDSMQAIMKAQEEFVMTMKAGGGVGCNFSVLRPAGTTIKTTAATSSGVVSFLEGFDAWCSTIKAGNSRRGAMMAVLDIWHPEIIGFIKAKSEKGKLNNFNISIAITHKFMEAVEKDEEWDLVFPDITDEDYDLWDGDLDKWLSMGKTTIVYDTVKAKELFDLIMKSNYDFAEPGVLFIDTINENNNVKYWGSVRSTNPCGEQPLLPYESCNLGAINLVKFVLNPFDDDAHIDKQALKETVRYGVRALNKVLDINNFPLQKFKDTTSKLRPIGLGIMGFGSMLNMLNIRYDSDKAVAMAHSLGAIIANEAYKESAIMAKEFAPFPAFKKDEFLKSEFVKKLNKAIRDMIAEHGIMNSRLLTIAPTGTTAILADNVSGGLEPLYSLQYTRDIKQKDGTTKQEKVMDYSWWLHCQKYKNDRAVPVLDCFEATATQISPEAHINIQSAWQYWIDSSISKTTNVPKDISFDDFKNIYKYAYRMDLKGCTTYRPNDVVGSVLRVDQESKYQERKQHIGNGDLNNLYEIVLEDDEPAIRHIARWKNKSKVYIIITITEDGYPLEIFTKLPKDAGDGLHQFERDQFFEYVSNWDAICRTASTLLRIGMPIPEITKQLDKSAYGMFDCSAILARKLKTYPRNVTFMIHNKEDDDCEENYEIDDMVESTNETVLINKTDTCPECNANLIEQEGCKLCMSCGYSRCS